MHRKVQFGIPSATSTCAHSGHITRGPRERSTQSFPQPSISFSLNLLSTLGVGVGPSMTHVFLGHVLWGPLFAPVPLSAFLSSEGWVFTQHPPSFSLPARVHGRIHVPAVGHFSRGCNSHKAAAVTADASQAGQGAPREAQ